MPKAHREWTVLRHGPIEELSSSLWRVVGSLENMPLERVMTIAKRSDGGLVVHNAIALDEASMRRIDAWGPVTTIVVPNGYHRLDAPSFKHRYPDARVVTPRGSRAAVEEVIHVDDDYESYASDGVVSLETLAGVQGKEGLMRVRDASGTTLVFNDAIFNLPHQSGFSGLVLRYLTRSTGGPRVTRVMKWMVLRERGPFRKQLEALARTEDLERVIVSHGEMVEGHAAATEMLRRAIATID